MRNGALPGKSISPSYGELKTTSAGASGTAGSAVSSTIIGTSGAVAAATAVPAIVTRPRVWVTVPVTCSHCPVSTRASTDRSKSFPLGRRSVTQTAAFAERSTKSYWLFRGVLGRSANRLRPRNWPTTVTSWPSNRHGCVARPRTEGVVTSGVSVTAETSSTNSSPGRGHCSTSRARLYVIRRTSPGSNRPISRSCPRTSTGPETVLALLN